MPNIRSVAITSLVISFLLVVFSASAQTDSLPPVKDSSGLVFVRIHDITIDGNKKTRRHIILRELTFAQGDTILLNELMRQFEISRNQLQNTGLFNEVVMNIKNWSGDSVDVSVTVKERWYMIPLPTLSLYDRNFNVWWVEHNHDIRWLQFGGRFYQKNLTGRNDELHLAALFGFRQRFEAQYVLPAFDPIQKHGFSISSTYTQSKSITYALDSNKELIYEDVNNYLRKIFETSVDLYYRPKFNYRYTFTLGYKYSSVLDTIAQLNPNYFLNGNTSQQYLYGKVTFVRDFRDITAYPLKGNYLELSASKLGFGLFDDVNIWTATAMFSQYVSVGKKWYVTSQNKLKVSFPEEQPYSMEGGLGYGNDYVSGYEYYAIDGQSFGYTKLNLKNEIFKISLPSSPKNPFTKGAGLPIRMYGRVYIDAGYVRDRTFSENNPVTNTFLLGGGVGIDLVLIYDTTLRFEYSVNKLGEHGLFFHYNTLF